MYFKNPEKNFKNMEKMCTKHLSTLIFVKLLNSNIINKKDTIHKLLNRKG